MPGVPVSAVALGAVSPLSRSCGKVNSTATTIQQHITRISSFSFATNPLSFMLFVSCFIEFKINIILLTIVVLKMGKSF